MTATCDSLLCGRPATHRVGGRGYCDRHAEALAATVNAQAGRRIVRPTRLTAITLVVA